MILRTDRALKRCLGDTNAILDRLVHNARRIELADESMRRTRSKQIQKA